MRYLVAADASVLDYQGLGWAIIQNLDVDGVRHKAIARRLPKKNSSTLMELTTVYAVFQALPSDIELELINDCQMMHDLYFWHSVDWLNSKRVLTLEAKQLKAIYDLAKEKNIQFVVKDKHTHQYHSDCDMNCHRFREELSRAGKMYHLFTLTPEWKAKFNSSHRTVVAAQKYANTLGKLRAAKELPKLLTVISLSRNIGEKIKDLKGRVYEVVE